MVSLQTSHYTNLISFPTQLSSYHAQHNFCSLRGGGKTNRNIFFLPTFTDRRFVLTIGLRNLSIGRSFCPHLVDNFHFSLQGNTLQHPNCQHHYFGTFGAKTKVRGPVVAGSQPATETAAKVRKVALTFIHISYNEPAIDTFLFSL